MTVTKAAMGTPEPEPSYETATAEPPEDASMAFGRGRLERVEVGAPDLNKPTTK